MSETKETLAEPKSTSGTIAFLFPFATIVLWAGNTIVTKSAAAVIDPASIALYRWVLAFSVLTPFVGRAVWRQRAVVRAQWPKLAVLGVLGMATYQGLAYEAARTTTAINMGVIIALMPLMTTLLASVFSGEPLTLRRILGTLISLAGLIVLTTSGDPLNLLNSSIHIGDGLMLIAVFANALYGVLLRRWAIPIPTWQQLYAQIAFGTLFILPFWLAGPMSPVTVASAPLILYAVVGASILAPFLWITGVKQLGAARATLFINLLPPIVAILAWSILGEQLHGYHVVGGLVALLGVAIGL